MSDQWSGAEDDVSRLKDMPGAPGTDSASNTGFGVGEVTSGQIGDASTFGSETALGSADMSGSESAGGTGGTMDKAKEAMSGVTEMASGIGSQATSKADAGIEKAAGGLESLATTLRDRGESMGEGQVGSLATAAAERMSSGAEMLRGKDTEQMMTDLEALIRRRPMESLLVAAGIGYLISRAK